jgi:photosystem II stability/assembly factor-like uncharacterized protein
MNGDSRFQVRGSVGLFPEDRGEHWERLDSPMNQLPVWALAIDPVDPNVIFAGTKPAALFRSKDGGQTWQVVTSGVNDPDIHNLAITVGPPKTLLTITPREVFCSIDAGDSWSKFQREFGEVHALAWVPN